MRRIAPRALLLGALLLSTGSVESADEVEPVTVEMIVRLHVAGTPSGELIRLIRSQPTHFENIPEEMLSELRQAGLPEAVIAAMQEQKELLARERADTLDRGWSSGAPLRVLLNAGQQKSKRRRIRVRDEVDPYLAMEWRLGNAPEDRRFVDVAIFLACRSPDHVPDGWREKTPLRWDSPIVRRHRLLVFVSGATWREASWFKRISLEPDGGSYTNDGGQASSGVGLNESYGTLELSIPEEIETPLVPGVAHDVTVGIALKIREDYYPWIVSSIDGVVIDESGESLEVRIRGSGANDLEIQFESGEARQDRAYESSGR